MFSFFSKLLSQEQQDVLNDVFVIQVNDYSYDIPDEQSFNELKETFMGFVLENKLLDVKPSDIKYNVTFLNNNNKKLVVSVSKREYIIQLLELINKNVLPRKLESMSLSS